MLSADDLIKSLELPDDHVDKLTIVPFPEVEQLRKRAGTSIDLRLGRWFRSFKQSQFGSVSLVGPGGDAVEDGRESSRTKEHFVPFGKPFVLHPGRFVLGVTLEWLRLPSSLSGYVTGKSSLGRHGLVIETAAGLHPKFSGCLTLELANVGEVPLQVYPGMQICQVFLHATTVSKGSDLGVFSGKRKPMLSPLQADETYLRLVDNEDA